MSQISQVFAVATLATCFVVVVLALARKGRLSMRYTLGWVFVAVSIAVGSVFAGVVEPLAERLGVNPAVVVAAAVCSGLLAIMVQLSISVSGLIEANRELTESLALAEERLQRLAQSGHQGASRLPP
jgi:hypothetical protein